MKIILAILTLTTSSISWSRGKLLLIGGGHKPVSIMNEIMSLSGGNILIISLASEYSQETGLDIKNDLEALGAKEVSVFSCNHRRKDLPQCLREIQNAKLIYFSGGSQLRLLDGLSGTESLKLIKRRFEENLHLAGTSAGTAVMSEVMITGNVLSPYNEFDAIRPKMVETTPGFGFLKKIIIDQHFIKRSRQNRLISAVLDRPGLIGVGVDESTAILVHEDESFDVLGDSAVMVIDSRRSQISMRNDYYHVKDLKVELLLSGQQYTYKPSLNSRE